MKALKEYLNESLNIVMQKDGLQLITLVSRDIECPSLTAEHFSTIMMEDLELLPKEVITLHHMLVHIMYLVKNMKGMSG